MKDQDDLDEPITLMEASKMMGVEYHTVNRRCHDGSLKCTRTMPETGKLRTTRRWVNEFMEKCVL